MFAGKRDVHARENGACAAFSGGKEYTSKTSDQMNLTDVLW